tara:strand:- start:212 stop:670 length:459 start_codon:yes stop_codon:yes gene_type:complete
MVSELFLIVLAVTIPISLMVIFVAKLFRKNAEIDPDITRKRLKQMTEYIADLEKKNRSKQNKINSMQTGPRIEGNIDDLGGVIGPLLQGMQGHMPKWLSSIIGSNPEMLKQAETMIMDYAKKNPEQVKSIIGRFVKGKTTPAANEETALQGL